MSGASPMSNLVALKAANPSAGGGPRSSAAAAVQSTAAAGGVGGPSPSPSTPSTGAGPVFTPTADPYQQALNSYAAQKPAAPNAPSTPTVGGTGSSGGGSSGALISNADSWLGTPYAYGGTSRSGVDCSGFTQAVYQSVGKNIGRDTTQQFASGNKVGVDGNFQATASQLQPGDLVFYGQQGASGPDAHVALYIGNGQVMQAPHTGASVDVVPLYSAASSSEPFLGARRYL